VRKIRFRQSSIFNFIGRNVEKNEFRIRKARSLRLIHPDRDILRIISRSDKNFHYYKEIAAYDMIKKTCHNFAMPCNAVTLIKKYI